MASMSPSESSTNNADVPGFISACACLTKSSEMPVDATSAPAVLTTIAPIVARRIGALTTKPARKPTAEQPTTLGTAGNRSRSRVNDPSRWHDHGDVLEEKRIPAPAQTDDLIADLVRARLVVVPDNPQMLC